MKVVAAILIFIGFTGAFGSIDGYITTQPYDNGLVATATVIAHADYGSHLRPIVVYTDSGGVKREAHLASDGRMQLGTELEVSYRSEDPSTVRAPSERTVGVNVIALFVLAFLAGIAMLWNPRSAAKNQTKLSGSMASRPAVLMHWVKTLVEPNLGQTVLTAFQVIERRPIAVTMAPFGLICVCLLVGAELYGTEDADMFAILAMVAMLPVLAVFVRNRRAGVVLVTEQEYVLLIAAGGDLRTTTIGGRIPRSTPLPNVIVTRRGIICGGPLPFVSQNDDQFWHYAGNHFGFRKAGYYDLIGGLVAGAAPSAPADEPTWSAARDHRQ